MVGGYDRSVSKVLHPRRRLTSCVERWRLSFHPARSTTKSFSPPPSPPTKLIGNYSNSNDAISNFRRLWNLDPRRRKRKERKKGTDCSKTVKSGRVTTRERERERTGVQGSACPTPRCDVMSLRTETHPFLLNIAMWKYASGRGMKLADRRVTVRTRGCEIDEFDEPRASCVHSYCSRAGPSREIRQVF